MRRIGLHLLWTRLLAITDLPLDPLFACYVSVVTTLSGSSDTIIHKFTVAPCG